MKALIVFAAVLGAASAQAASSVPMHIVDAKGVGVDAGSVALSDTKYGLVLTPSLHGLPPGLHGFHVHQNPSCEPKEKDGKMVAALGAGDHLDPAKTGRHGEPWGDGHLGDLPPLYVDADGKASQPVLAPRLKVADLAGRALMLHAGGDNHSDHPAPLGGGGGRIACGVLK